MKRIISFFSILFFCFQTNILANGVCIINASTNENLKLISSEINISVESQISITTTTQTFKNTFSIPENFKYAFPLKQQASAVGLRWYINGVWHQASISPTNQDTTLPGGGTIHPNLKSYLGQTPLYFDITDTLQVDSLVIFELTYVELLHYELGNVTYFYSNDYSLIQTSPLNAQEFNFTLNSQRTIDSIKILNLTPTLITNDGHLAIIQYSISESPANFDYEVNYMLNPEELGLFSFSTFEPDSLVPDSLARGYFTFIAEPDPTQNTESIHKVFTLIVDRSGSMMGDKIIQAKNAASFIVQHLNEGDMFNIVDFSDYVNSFKNEHVPFNQQNETDALNYISGFQANGSTNISGAFDVAVPQFATATDSTANIIIFFTDGQATAGITETEQLVQHIDNLIAETETNIFLFSFGIGMDVNHQLLTLLSSNNQGFAQFLENNELEEEITHFYLLISNPVLLNTQISFTPNVVSEVYPDPLPNLYKGQQMIVSGRYSEPTQVNVTLSGNAFGQQVSYNYSMNLVDSSVTSYRFIPKLWAISKIEHLLVLYYSLDPNSQEAEEIKDQIIQISIQYGVITPFTSFGDPLVYVNEENADNQNKHENIIQGYKILGNYPNPFNPSTTIRFIVGKNLNKMIAIKIYNSIGQLVKVLFVNIHGKGTYDVRWDGTLQNGSIAPSDIYIYVIDFGDAVLAQKMILLK